LFFGVVSVLVGGVVPVPVSVLAGVGVPIVSVGVVVASVAGGGMLDMSPDVLPVSGVAVVAVASVDSVVDAGVVVSGVDAGSDAVSVRLQAVRISSAAAVARIFFMMCARSWGSGACPTAAFQTFRQQRVKRM
jgi:hypothetical protein